MNQMQHYREVKNKHPGMILVFRVGDTFEMYGEDAEAAARMLSLGLTQRTVKDSGEKVSVTGFPRNSLETYLRQLLKAGHRVAICDQVEQMSLEKPAEKIQRTFFDYVD